MEKETVHEETSEKEQKDSQIRKINDQIGEETKRLHLIEQLHNEFEEISITVSRCIDLVAKSAQGERADALYEDMHNTNRTITKGARDMFEKDTTRIQNSIETMNQEKQKLVQEKEEKEEKDV